ncbi:hypothetical protein [Flavobacterium aestivum]|uniref:hypothetical protein n=1 Tax=Flavobacterium aestivum TaxID=3003257 RepID=UPI002482D486|nr:hypothetical protein [Flavobacterium aestivum]
MENTSKLNRLKALSGVLLLGILGTALWELLIRDLIFYIGNLFVSTFSLFYKGYVNDMYSHIFASEYSFQILPSIIIILVIIALPIYLFIKVQFAFIKHESTENDIKSGIIADAIFNILKKKGRASFMFILTGISIILMYSDLLIKQISGSEAYRIIDKNLIIIKPYIPEREYDLLQSEFRLVNSKDKLLHLIIEINKIANKNKIDLGESKLLALGTVKNIK